MKAYSIRILLVEDNPGDARLIQEMLSEVSNVQFSMVCVDRLADVVDYLSQETCDVVLLDLSLPDMQGRDTYFEMRVLAPDLPIVVLTGLEDEALAVQLVQNGAQDYLSKGDLSSTILVRSIRHAIERHRLQTELENLVLIDELTSLYNRRGFFTLAEQQLKIVQRTGRSMLLVYADLNGLKQINDSFGHQAGDQALVGAAAILMETFRASDIIARIGGDEFAILVLETARDSLERIKARLFQAQAAYNQDVEHEFQVVLSIGIARYHPDTSRSIDALLSQADALMYAQKSKS